MHAAFYFNDSVMFAMGRPDWQFYLGLLNAGANVLAFTIAVRWGIVAVAVAFATRNLLVAPLPLYLVRRLIKIEWTEYLTAYGPPAVGTGSMAGMVFGLRWGMSGVGDAALLAAAVPLSAAVYVGALALVAPKRLGRLWGLVAEIVVP
jgi:PST family polysaccharide transporter